LGLGPCDNSKVETMGNQQEILQLLYGGNPQRLYVENNNYLLLKDSPTLSERE